MSGTSADGIDAALIRQSDKHIELLHHSSQLFPGALRQSVLSLNQPGPDEITHMGRCARQLGRAYAGIVDTLLQTSGFSRDQIDVIGCHGQTIRHQPAGRDGFTLQIGQAEDIVESTGITTAADFRPRDLAAGGQGAPLVPPLPSGTVSDPSAAHHPQSRRHGQPHMATAASIPGRARGLRHRSGQCPAGCPVATAQPGREAL